MNYKSKTIQSIFISVASSEISKSNEEYRKQNLLFNSLLIETKGYYSLHYIRRFVVNAIRDEIERKF